MEGHVGRAESMEVKNDPRFFQDNVINYRLAAFGSVSVISSLLVSNAMGDLWDMDKNMQIYTSQGKIFHIHGFLQMLAFVMLLIVFFINMMSVYVGVVQPYHTIRLMTAGPMGFETAVSYYLNRNIVAWRHIAIKYMLLSLPLYISQMGVRLIVKFDRSNTDQGPGPHTTPMAGLVEGIVFGVIMLMLSIMLYSVHEKHFAIFRDRHEAIARSATGHDFNTYMTEMMTRRRNQHLDV